MSDEKCETNLNPAKVISTPKDAILKYFSYSHLPPYLQAVSKPFCILAKSIAGVTEAGEIAVVDCLPPGPERTVALRKLLEAKDAAVRTLV